jgi:hypothetical protein
MHRPILVRPAFDESGSTVAEAAILIPIAMLIVFLAVQASLWAHGATLVQNAAAQGVEAATLSGGSPATAVAQAEQLLKATGGHVVLDPSVRVSEMSGGEIQVEVSGRVESIIPGLRLPVSATQVGFIQEFRQSG